MSKKPTVLMILDGLWIKREYETVMQLRRQPHRLWIN